MTKLETDDCTLTIDCPIEPDPEDGEALPRRTHNQKIAAWGETAAAAYLRASGYEILERNWRCDGGEADIIAMDGTDLVFLEVKTRSSLKQGFPEEAVTPAKRQRYERIAAYYLKDHDTPTLPLRFDVIGILVLGEDRCIVKHHVNAFGVA